MKRKKGSCLGTSVVVTRSKRGSALRLGHALREKGSCAHSWEALVRWTVGSVTERCLWHGNVGSILGIV